MGDCRQEVLSASFSVHLGSRMSNYWKFVLPSRPPRSLKASNEEDGYPGLCIMTIYISLKQLIVATCLLYFTCILISQQKIPRRFHQCATNDSKHQAPSLNDVTSWTPLTLAMELRTSFVGAPSTPMAIMASLPLSATDTVM